MEAISCFKKRFIELRTVIINGSARIPGNTNLIDLFIKSQINAGIINLSMYNIESYNYDHEYSKQDQFLSIVEKIINSYDCLIWSTPMYWYSMSGIMKNFLDRFTELLKTHKDLGRKLKGKSMALVYNSNGKQELYFEKPFENTADYLSMVFKGSYHQNMETSTLNDSDRQKIIDFCSLFI